ncbi:MAG: hypothetical protein JWN46_2954 [Acidimicrobiales bacterium]|nr:hypothetical protein [Acidimicrobiales bacterium]
MNASRGIARRMALLVGAAAAVAAMRAPPRADAQASIGSCPSTLGSLKQLPAASGVAGTSSARSWHCFYQSDDLKALVGILIFWVTDAADPETAATGCGVPKPPSNEYGAGIVSATAHAYAAVSLKGTVPLDASTAAEQLARDDLRLVATEAATCRAAGSGAGPTTTTSTYLPSPSSGRPRTTTHSNRGALLAGGVLVGLVAAGAVMGVSVARRGKRGEPATAGPGGSPDPWGGWPETWPGQPQPPGGPTDEPESASYGPLRDELDPPPPPPPPPPRPHITLPPGAPRPQWPISPDPGAGQIGSIGSIGELRKKLTPEEIELINWFGSGFRVLPEDLEPPAPPPPPPPPLKPPVPPNDEPSGEPGTGTPPPPKPPKPPRPVLPPGLVPPVVVPPAVAPLIPMPATPPAPHARVGASAELPKLPLAAEAPATRPAAEPAGHDPPVKREPRPELTSIQRGAAFVGLVSFGAFSGGVTFMAAGAWALGEGAAYVIWHHGESLRVVDGGPVVESFKEAALAELQVATSERQRTLQLVVPGMDAGERAILTGNDPGPARDIKDVLARAKERADDIHRDGYGTEGHP